MLAGSIGSLSISNMKGLLVGYAWAILLGGKICVDVAMAVVKGICLVVAPVVSVDGSAMSCNIVKVFICAKSSAIGGTIEFLDEGK